MKYTKKHMYKQKKKQTRKRKYKQTHRRTHKRKGLKKRKRTRRKRGGDLFNKSPKKKVDDYGTLDPNGGKPIPSAGRAAPLPVQLPVQLEAKRRYPRVEDLENHESPTLDLSEPTRIVIMASHQARIQCELNFFGLLGKPKDKHGKSIRFKNGAVLKVMIRGTIMRVELFHDGELTPGKSDHNGFMNGKKPYFVTQENFVTIPGDTQPKGQYIFYTQQYNSLNFPYTKISDFDIYLIRHGEGTHNVSKWGPVKGIFNQAADLTDDGVEQAKRTGLKLETIITSATVPITLASSDIPRAINTMITIRDISSLDNKEPIHIVPCSHEIPHKKPPCDGHGMAAGENDSQGDDYYKKLENSEFLSSTTYLQFYSNHSRSGQKKRGGVLSSSRSWCRDSSMFEQITKLVNDEEFKKRNAQEKAVTAEQGYADAQALREYDNSARVVYKDPLTSHPPEAGGGEDDDEDEHESERPTVVSMHASNGHATNGDPVSLELPNDAVDNDDDDNDDDDNDGGDSEDVKAAAAASAAAPRGLPRYARHQRGHG